MYQLSHALGTNEKAISDSEVHPQEKRVNESDVHFEKWSSNNDTALWDLKDKRTIDYWVRCGPDACQNHDADLSRSQRTYGETLDGNLKTRSLTSNVFSRKLQNEEHIKREWLLYSPSLGRLFCFVCRLFSKEEGAFVTSGFNDWKHICLVNSHENSRGHREFMTAYAHRHSQSCNVNNDLLRQQREQQEYWRKVLVRISTVIRFLASRGLAFRGANQIIGSSGNGNYLGILELVSEFDPFLKNHLQLYGNPGKDIKFTNF